MNEKLIQDALYHKLRLKNRWPIFPNCDTITGFEADLLALTKARMVYEYEIKCSLSDLRADLKKLNKWASLRGDCKPWPQPGARDASTMFVRSEMPNPVVGEFWKPYEFRCHPDRRPVEFWYVCHGFSPPIADIPDLAGVMVAKPRETEPQTASCYTFEVLREARKLESMPAKESLVEHALRNMLYRYWNYRTR